MYPIKTKVPYNPATLDKDWMTYTTAYLGNYVANDFAENVGSHPGVDIVPVTPHDTVVSVLPGIVKMAIEDNAYGKHIVIAHAGVPDPKSDSGTTTLYSCYLHLSDMCVTVWQAVDEGDAIGKTGNTGANSTNEHLHFQIDCANAPFHPYWPFTGTEQSAAGLTFFSAVNAGLGMEKAKLYTINPLVYLDSDRVKNMDSMSAPMTTSITPATTTTPTTTTVSGETIRKPVIPDPITPEPDPILMNPIADPVSPSLVKVFKDVSVSNHYYKAITDLATRGIIEGTNGSFHPDANVTRAELLKIVFLAGGIAVDSIAEATFSDVSSYDWAYPYVATALKMQAIHGFPDGTFRPNNPVTRAEGCKIIVNLLKKSSLDPVSFPVFSDVKTTDWVHSYANYAKTHDFFVFKNNRFLPQQLLTRGECANAVCNC